jgi:hypothetical protein
MFVSRVLWVGTRVHSQGRSGICGERSGSRAGSFDGISVQTCHCTHFLVVIIIFFTIFCLSSGMKITFPEISVPVY